MRRVLVIGSGGAGKSTFAARLGRLLNIEVIHLDALFWNPGWVETPREEWASVVEELVKGDSWILDGNYGGTLDLRLAACDTVIFLDIPRRVCLWRVLKRTIRHRKGSRPDMGKGCPERLDWQFLKWVWSYPKERRPVILKKLEACSQSKNVFRLQSQREIERFLAVAPRQKL
ncbi:MAG TPA: DNA topology modulation protein [Blastocatellia bacterium]|nr:DNA topology modulation protein [Blastocatellia bacterium]